jgi:hypothetical protein
MTKIKRAIMVAAMLGLAVFVRVRTGLTAPADIANMPWDESNVATLRSASIADIEKLICGDEQPCGASVNRFEWADLEGKGKYGLVCVFTYGGKVQTVNIYQRDGSGKINEQSIDLEDYGHEDLSTSPIRDLNGDGKKELIINSGFGEGRFMAETPLTQWPMVYRLKDGQYVEASREFPGFYDKEVLPPLEAKIAALEKNLDSEAEAKAAGEAVIKEYSPSQPEIDSHTSPEQRKAVRDSEQLALQQSLRIHILHVLGRKPTAEEEKEALEWLNSPDYWVRKYAEPTLAEM